MTVSSDDVAAAQQLIHGYFNAMDSGDYKGALECLTDAVEWYVSSHPSGQISGKANVERALADRVVTYEARHLVTNLHLADGKELEAFFLIESFVHVRQDGDTLPHPIVPPSSLSDVRVKLARVGDALKISHLRVTTIMREAKQ